MPPRLRLSSKREKSNRINAKKQKMAKYLSKGLKVNEACLLAQVTKTELAEMRSDVTFEDFVKMLLREEENLAKQIFIKHKLFYNSEIYYQLLKEAHKHGFRP